MAIQCGAPINEIAKFVRITPIAMAYDTQIPIVFMDIHGVCKPTYNWGAHILDKKINSSRLDVRLLDDSM